ncbi:MAG: hypothetical protein GXP38_17915 [Chloroflexi bacterium]|nr:hypothetical protein [Chloroflexota bacterium]
MSRKSRWQHYTRVSPYLLAFAAKIRSRLGLAALTAGLTMLLFGSLLPFAGPIPAQATGASRDVLAKPAMIQENTAGEWVLTKVSYTNSYWSDFFAWSKDDFGTLPLAGGAISYSHSWTWLDDSKSWEGQITSELVLPQTIPLGGSAEIATRGKAQWRLAGLTDWGDGDWAGGLYARVYGGAPFETCDPERIEVSADEMQNRTTNMASGWARCTLNPVLLSPGVDRFTVFLLIDSYTRGVRPGKTTYRVQTWLEITYIYCANQSNCISIEGSVYTVPDEEGRIPLIGVPITLLRNGKFMKQTITLPPFGEYEFSSVPITDSLTLSVTLRMLSSPLLFRSNTGSKPVLSCRSGPDPLVPMPPLHPFLVTWFLRTSLVSTISPGSTPMSIVLNLMIWQ